MDSAKLSHLYKGRIVAKRQPPSLKVTMDSAHVRQESLLTPWRPSVKKSPQIQVRHNKPLAVGDAARGTVSAKKPITMVVHGASKQVVVKIEPTNTICNGGVRYQTSLQ